MTCQIVFLSDFINSSLYQMTKFWTSPNSMDLQTTIQCESKIEICFGKSRKHCGKRRKCWLPAFSPFPTNFSKGLFLRVVKSQDCVLKS